MNNGIIPLESKYSLMKFSQRIGKTPIKNILQVESMDDDLRNALWNAFHFFIGQECHQYFTEELDRKEFKFLSLFWMDFLKEPVDKVPSVTSNAIKSIRDRFFDGWEWYEVYDFLEFTAGALEEKTDEFVGYCNEILERENSGYRFINNVITQVTNKTEIDSIEEAIDSTESIKGANLHLQVALSKLADKKSPDYRNSIKESISAVESICGAIVNEKKLSFGDMLKKLNLHPALIKGFSSIYGYTSDAQGIRHALMDEPTLTYDDAKYMLVSCSAFINYLIAYAIKEKLKIK